MEITTHRVHQLDPHTRRPSTRGKGLLRTDSTHCGGSTVEVSFGDKGGTESAVPKLGSSVDFRCGEDASRALLYPMTAGRPFYELGHAYITQTTFIDKPSRCFRELDAEILHSCSRVITKLLRACFIFSFVLFPPFFGGSQPFLDKCPPFGPVQIQ